MPHAYGRRITLITTFTIYTGATLVLTFISNSAMLPVLRVFQAAGPSATISTVTGVMGAIAAPHFTEC